MIHNSLKRSILIFFLLCISLALVVGCNGSSDPDPTATQESIPTNLPEEPTAEPEPEPTAEPEMTSEPEMTTPSLATVAATVSASVIFLNAICALFAL